MCATHHCMGQSVAINAIGESLVTEREGAKETVIVSAIFLAGVEFFVKSVLVGSIPMTAPTLANGTFRVVVMVVARGTASVFVTTDGWAMRVMPVLQGTLGATARISILRARKIRATDTGSADQADASVILAMAVQPAWHALKRTRLRGAK